MYFVLNCNVLALLSFYALPSGGNWKTRWSIAILTMTVILYNEGEIWLDLRFKNEKISLKHIFNFFLFVFQDKNQHRTHFKRGPFAPSSSLRSFHGTQDSHWHGFKHLLCAKIEAYDWEHFYLSFGTNFIGLDEKTLSYDFLHYSNMKVWQ